MAQPTPEVRVTDTDSKETGITLPFRESSSNKPHLDSYPSLDNLLRRRLNKHREGRHKDFLTLHCLQQLLTIERVRKHLEILFQEANQGGYRPRRASAEDYLELICDHDQLSNSSMLVKRETCIRLFAILILANKGAEIFKFIDNSVHDKALPINIHDENLLDEDVQWCIEHWTELRYRDDFYMWQWKVNVPFLFYGQHQIFSAQVILPFTEPGSDSGHSTHSGVTVHNYSVTEAGGYGEVKCVEIHSKCHNFHEVFTTLPRREGPFAVKKLLQNDPIRIEKDFQKEVEMLKKFDGGVHPHIVTVLTTFKHGDCYYLIFPWAECDLGRYFENNRMPTHSLETVRWLSSQCLKIIEAVHLIHFPPGVNNLQPGDRLFGRHGDIKAENILVFRSQNGEANLVLSDFGLGSVHRDISRSNVPSNKVAVTPDFRPPECDMDGGRISRAYDVWTLGCLFLDLLTWLLGGEDLREEFENTRMTSYIDGRETRIYFEIVQTEDDKKGFIIKDQVRSWFDKLRKHSNCTKFVHEFLKLIEEDMLIVETNEKKRARTDVLLEKLRSFSEKCHGDKADLYCLHGVSDTGDPATKSVPPIVEGLLNDAATRNIKERRIPLRTVRGRTQQAEQAQDGVEIRIA
ncbi:kinase-like domain-containing protein [Annulohypoxylon maeteangense]|uniref:kinase-like domain-containing protein n=1 Tax=Annulohypoxylon maeteangense TaxID=1927788 RepID=UPI002007A98D|nr:kinase-like domain-containing protein [Annulohypoxylon maeteangense]KAI0882890.1 kinase-like domain-containing protein [Annulohypoxylon maeteangense]